MAAAQVFPGAERKLPRMPVYGQGRNQTALAALHPSLHGLRHPFAVSTILDAYGDGGDVEERLAALST